MSQPVNLLPVFLDPTGRRWRRMRYAGLALLLLATVGLFYLAVGVLVPPALPGWTGGDSTMPPTHRRHPSWSTRLAWLRHAGRAAYSGTATRPSRVHHSHDPVRRAAPIRAGFYVNWDDDAWQSLTQHVQQLDWLIAEWGFLRADTGALEMRPDPRVQTLLAQQPADRRPRLLTMITNVDSGGRAFSGARVATLVASPHARAAFVHSVARMVQQYHLGGVVIDFEMVPADAHRGVTTLLRELRQTLAPAHALVAVTVAADAEPAMLQQWSAASDMVIAMLYDEHSSRDEPGPVASQAWFERSARRMLQVIPANRLMLAFGAFGYEWNDADGAPQATAMTYAEAIAAARQHHVLPQWNADLMQPSIQWIDADSTDHVLWYLDAVTSWNALQSASSLGVAGEAVWRLGAEDPSLWRIFGRNTSPMAWPELGPLPPGYGVEIQGNGELLRVTSHPSAGERQLVHDSVSGMLTNERWLSLPSAWTVERTGASHPHRVALTFDDGPDDRWTPMLLDTLRARHAQATFFVIGEQVQQHIALTRRMAAEGHALGSHTFTHPDLSRVSPFATRLELDATARLLEAVVGRHTMLFRPPYFGDAEPSTIDELEPVEAATALGYLTAGVHIDSDDWKRPGVTAIIARTLHQRERGNIVLLHDGGGDRAQTVAAVGPLIDSLRARGDTIVPLEALVDAPMQTFMPPLSPESARHRWLALGGYSAVSALEWLIVTTLTVAVSMGVVRMLLLTALAIRQRWQSAHHPLPITFAPSVSVIVPAYREQSVIVATVHSLLQQQYAGALEIIVVDDGSPDDTYAIARNTFAADKRVMVLTKPNGGKASALNLGIARAHGEVIVGLDADTVFAPDAIAELVQPLRDPQVGAVAGNAKVGNRINLVTRWQAVEYITSQNLDRRAFTNLNAITVVPGAIGAWRASAVREAGGFTQDTLAEDQDLTITLRRRGWRIAYADAAVAYTEAPDSLRTLARQRFRWAFGTLQCAWKHRDTLLRPTYGSLGLIAMPNTWLFQLAFTALSPLADLLFVLSLTRVAIVWQQHGATYAGTDVRHIISLYLLFLLTDVGSAVIALLMEPLESHRLAWLVPLQRFAYRQVMYWVVLRSLAAAARGRVVGWGNLERKATVSPLLPAIVLVCCLTSIAPVVGRAQPVTTSAVTAVAPAAQLTPAQLRRFPLTEMPAANGRTLALFWSGDGGWKELVDGVSQELVRQGVAVVGMNSRSWLTSATRTPDSLSHDSVLLLRHYLAAWQRDRILLIGYSRGAGFSALLAEQLPPDLRAKVIGVALLGMEHTASFEFHLLDLVRTVSRPTDILVKPFIERITWTPVLCIYGKTEDDTVCPELDATRAHILPRDGDHHFDRNYPQIAHDILTRVAH
ncbi:MAG TPA: polysaccharide deacetylase [Gemmatimonas aurantiaca]|uniref:Polysaccharide deacetylase n=2 Tax=Gemmatimonas aurantiaca TaxID=173480 RepID=A0A3D4VBV7_9BACT|nr:AcvB/VirJ family lysyl-phosphatidylglycerol hydrolase [Gemmatimonas aurantiaca]BAH40183.1 putative glycosyl transferase/polysaccharide deacetylase [Gemmatimonas aurantiaca T-27]HCT57807.1 polysaccharide deacetylase [Gemmatimonas aurantiaca]